MQLGTRWTFGDTAPASIGDDMVVAIAAVEAELAEYETTAWRWTLTWLEGRPVAELDDGTIVRRTADGDIVVTEPQD